MKNKVWTVFILELLLITILATSYSSKADAKTIVRNRKLRINAYYDHGDTILKFSDGRVRRYDFDGEIVVVERKRITHYNLKKNTVTVEEEKDKLYELTYDMLVTRRNKVIYIEVIKGKVINKRLDGEITNMGYDENGDLPYICYKRLKGKVRKDSKVTTYYVYNPYTTWIDDHDERYDVITRR